MAARGVVLRFDGRAPPFALKLTLPKRWVAREAWSKVLLTFVDSHNAKFPNEPIDAALARLHDATGRPVALDGVIGAALAALGADPELCVVVAAVSTETAGVLVTTGAGTPTPSTSLVDYVPRILVLPPPATLAVLREASQALLLQRAGAVLALFATRSDDGEVLAVRRVSSSDGTASPREALSVATAQTVYELRALCEPADGDFVCAAGRVWNQLGGLVAGAIVAGFLPLRREKGKLVANCHGRKWVLRVSFDGEACCDPSRIGAALGAVHKVSLRCGVEGEVKRLLEMPRKSALERFDDRLKWISATLSKHAGGGRNGVSGIAKRLCEIVTGEDFARLRSQPFIYTLSGDANRWAVRQHAETRVCVVDGVEAGGEGQRLCDFYSLYAQGRSVDVLRLSLRAYAAACGLPISATEARTLPLALWVQGAGELCRALDALADVQAAPARPRDDEAARAVGALRPESRPFRLDVVQRRIKRAQRVLKSIERDAEAITEAAFDSNPKLLENGRCTIVPDLQLLPPTLDDDAAPADANTGPADAASDTATPAAAAGGFWATWAAEAKRNQSKVGARRPRGYSGCLVDIFAGPPAAPQTASAAPLNGATSADADAAASDATCTSDAAAAASDGVCASAAVSKADLVACQIIELSRNLQRAAHVAEHLKKVLPQAVVVGAVDAMVQNELEAASEAPPFAPRRRCARAFLRRLATFFYKNVFLQKRRLVIDFHAWRLSSLTLRSHAQRPSRGHAAALLSHARCWQRVKDEQVGHCIILEDHVLLDPGFLSQAKTLISALPKTYDVAHLYLPRAHFRDDALPPKTPADGAAVVDASFWNPAYVSASLGCYVVSRKGAEKLLRIVENPVDAPVDVRMCRWFEGVEGPGGTLEGFGGKPPPGRQRPSTAPLLRRCLFTARAAATG
ncbi:hypothetical protein M885DRAFT_516820 [Pelagophyceae sp. CCMP2097]|nr:hypothetical protein M885DRAFT_516820 [Pelagophyceae sp. CCMP2097]